MEQSVTKIVLTPVECIEMLGCSRSMMYDNLLRRRDFPCFRIGKRIFINKEKLQTWIDKQCENRR